MGTNTYFFVGAYVKPPVIAEKEIKHRKICSAHESHAVKDQHAAFCSVCGSPIKEVVVSNRTVMKTLGLYHVLDSLSEEEKAELIEACKTQDLYDYFCYLHDTCEHLAWYLNHKDIKTHNICADYGDEANIEIGENDVASQKALFSTLFEPFAILIEKKYGVKMPVHYGVVVNYN